MLAPSQLLVLNVASQLADREAVPKFYLRVLLRTAVPGNLLSRFVAVVCNFRKRTAPGPAIACLR